MPPKPKPDGRGRSRFSLGTVWDDTKGLVKGLRSRSRAPSPETAVANKNVTTTNESALHGSGDHSHLAIPPETRLIVYSSKSSLGSSASQEPSPPAPVKARVTSVADNGETPVLEISTSTAKECGGETVKPTYWEKAQSRLTDQQRKVLKDFGVDHLECFEDELKRVQDLGNSCTNKLSKGAGPKGTHTMTRERVYGILKKMEEFAKIGDKVVQQSPGAVSLVWTGVRFCLQAALNDMQTFEAISSALDDIAGSYKAVVEQLPKAYAAVLRFIVEAISYSDKKYIVRLGEGVYKPFLTRFQPLLDDMNSSKMELERRARVGNDEFQNEANETQQAEFRKLNDQMTSFQTGIFEIANKLLRRANKLDKRKVLEWLSPIQVEAHHEETKKLRFEGTGEWLFLTKPFEKWVRAGSSIMWLSGKAGSGKTVLSSLVVDALAGTYKSVPTIYFYCYYGEKERREISTIIRALLRQIWALCEELDPELEFAYEKSTFLTTEFSKTLLEAGLSRFKEVFIVVDALDECSTEERRSIVELFTQIQPQGCHLKIFLTGRPEDDLKYFFEGKLSHHINADDTLKDIKPFVAATVDRHIASRKLLGGHVPSKLKEHLIETINTKADGMFLWVKFQLDYICEQANEQEVRIQLEKLPRGLGGKDGTYSRIWARITSEGSGDTEKKWALKTLKWLLHAKVPLKPQEILEATAIEPGSVTFDPTQKASSLDYLIRVCGGFVYLDEETEVLRFVHYSVQEFLRMEAELSSAESFLAEVCLTVLSFEEHSDISPDRGGIYSYAVLNWEKQATCWESIGERSDQLIQRFLLDDRYFKAWFSARVAKDWVNQSIMDTPYRAVSFFNLPVILRYLLQQRSYDRDPSLLSIAACYGHEKIVKLLLNSGADPNAKHENHEPALTEAASKGHEEIAKLLLNAGADPNAKHERHETALAAAVPEGHKEIVKLLLEAGANPGIRGRNNMLVLTKAVVHGYEGIVNLLLNAGADANAPCERFVTALTSAAEDDYKEIAKLLLKAGADINGPGEGLHFPLAKAAIEGHKEMVKLLLDAGANVNAENGYALKMAVEEGQEDIVKMLMANGATHDTQPEEATVGISSD